MWTLSITSVCCVRLCFSKTHSDQFKILCIVCNVPDIYASLQSGKSRPSPTVLFDVWLSKKKYQYSGLLAISQRMALRHESEGQPFRK